MESRCEHTKYYFVAMATVYEMLQMIYDNVSVCGDHNSWYITHSLAGRDYLTHRATA